MSQKPELELLKEAVRQVAERVSWKHLKELMMHEDIN